MYLYGVQALRAQLGESQQIFATKLGISIRALANYETGLRPPPVKVLAKLWARAAQEKCDAESAFYRDLFFSYLPLDELARFVPDASWKKTVQSNGRELTLTLKITSIKTPRTKTATS